MLYSAHYSRRGFGFVCGIAGYTHRGRGTDAGIAQRVTGTLLHRGPDQQGIFRSREICLSAVRLKIIDLAGGDQPLVSDDQNTVIAFNGEIYNHRALRRELEALGHRFHSRCDTEVVLHAFMQWDTGCFSRLHGMFAAAIWSEADGRLVLVRDHVGIKPLYFFRHGPDVYFGSELKAILEHPEVPRVVDLKALSYYLSLNYVPCPHTLIQGIEKLPPGHYLEWRKGEVAIHCWRRLQFREDKSWRLAAAKERLDFLLREVMGEALVADVPLGIWASGGVDSSTVLHYAAAAGSQRLTTFSISFQGRSFDESRHFRQIARHYGAEHHEFDLSPKVDLRSAIEEMVYYSDEPSADAGALPVWFLSRLSREHVTVALSGEGADELFGGYQTYLADRLARPLRLVPAVVRRKFLAACERHLPVSDEKIGLEYKLKRWLEGSLLPPDSAHFFWNGALSPAQLHQIWPGSPDADMELLVERLGIDQGTGLLNRYLWVDQSYYLPDDILYKVDRMSMAHSLEVRPPFLDPRIIQFAASLPEHLKIRGFRQKFVLKELMRDKLPASILRRKKTGLDIPAHDWFRGPLQPLLMDTLTPEAIGSTGIFCAGAIHSLISDHLNRRVNIGYQLWGLVVLFLWLKRWNVEIRVGEKASELAPALAVPKAAAG